jgi:hypothetical protein
MPASTVVAEPTTFVEYLRAQIDWDTLRLQARAHESLLGVRVASIGPKAALLPAGGAGDTLCAQRADWLFDRALRRVARYFGARVFVAEGEYFCAFPA